MARSDYPDYSCCKSCGKFVGCKGKKTKIVSCDSFRQATEEDIVGDIEEVLSVKVIMK